MANVFDDNLAAMRQGFPELYERFICIDMDTLQPEALVGHISDADAGAWLSNQEEPTSENILIFGLSDGKIVRHLVEQCVPDRRILIYEPSIINLIYTMGETDVRFLFQKGVRLIVDPLNEDHFMSVMEEMLTFQNYKDYQIYLLPGTEVAFPNARERFVRHFAKEGLGWMESRRSTERYWLHDSVRNLLYNIRYLKKNTVTPRLKDVIPADVPVILAGAGPSLKEEIDILKNCGSRAYLIAADTCVSYLLEQGVKPDAFVSVEPRRLVEYFEDERLRDIPLFTRVGTMENLLFWHRGVKIFMYEGEPFIHRLYREYEVPAPTYRGGVNGLTQLFAAMDEIGMNTVLLTGQDMCFGKAGETHVIRKKEDTEGRVAGAETINNQGEVVASRTDWVEMIRWYENALSDSNVEHVINTSLDGAALQGSLVMTLEEALDRFGKEHIPFSEIVEKCPKTFPPDKDFDPDFIYKKINKQLLEDSYEGLAGDLINKYIIADEKEDEKQSVEEGKKELLLLLEDLI